MAHAHPLAHDIVALTEQRRRAVAPKTVWQMRLDATVWHQDDAESRNCWVVYEIARTNGGMMVARPAESAIGHDEPLRVQNRPCCELTQAAQTSIAHDMLACMCDDAISALEDTAYHAEFSVTLDNDTMEFSWEQVVPVDLQHCKTGGARIEKLTSALLKGVQSCVGMYASLQFDVDW